MTTGRRDRRAAQLRRTGRESVGVKILWIDVETTGLDRRRNGIIQIAGLVDIDGRIVERFDLQMNPQAEFDPAAEAIHGVSQEEIDRYPSKRETLDRFKALLLRYVDAADPQTRFRPGGYNVRFDLGFLEQWFQDMGEPGLGLYFTRERVDPSFMMKAFQEYRGKLLMPSWSLRAVAAMMGLSYGDRHDALEDIEITREIHRRLIALFEPAVPGES